MAKSSIAGQRSNAMIVNLVPGRPIMANTSGKTTTPATTNNMPAILQTVSNIENALSVTKLRFSSSP